jgi:threonine/homoserine/homoserine lactone efflux protein
VSVFLTGFLAGLALAIPLGPMAILLISTTIKSGKSVGLFGALAMASVDFAYAAMVFAFGSALIGALNDWIWPMRVAGSMILVIVGIKIFLDARKASLKESLEVSNSNASRFRTYAKFFGLTILNPATAFYFVGITPSVAAMATASELVFAFLYFAGGVFIGSLVWQLTLVWATGITAKFLSVGIQRRVQYLGAGLIIALAIWLLLN